MKLNNINKIVSNLKKNGAIIPILIGIWAVVSYVISILQPALKPYTDSIIPSFGPEAITYSVYAFVSLLPALFLGNAIFETIKNKYKINPSIWLIFTIIIGGYIAIFGLIFIGTTNPTPVLNAKLFDLNHNNEYGSISCADLNGQAIANRLLRCQIKPVFNVKSLNTTSFLTNGTYIYSSSDSVIPEKNVIFSQENQEQIQMTIFGFDSTNTPHLLGTTINFKFPTTSENKQRQERIVALTLALFGLIAITVPARMVNLRELSKK